MLPLALSFNKENMLDGSGDLTARSCNGRGFLLVDVLIGKDGLAVLHHTDHT